MAKSRVGNSLFDFFVRIARFLRAKVRFTLFKVQNPFVARRSFQMSDASDSLQSLFFKERIKRKSEFPTLAKSDIKMTEK